MKKTILLFTLSVIICSATSAQISKGALLLGGDLSAYTQKQEVVSGTEYKSNGFMFSPLIGVATKNNLVQGGYLQIGSSKIENNASPGKTKNNNLGVGYFIRKYGLIKNNFYGFIQGNAGVGFYKNSYKAPGSEGNYKQTTGGINVSPGLSLKVSKKLHIESGLREIASISYQVNKNSSTTATSSDVLKASQFSVSSSLNNFTSNLYFGFRLLLGKG